MTTINLAGGDRNIKRLILFCPFSPLKKQLKTKTEISPMFTLQKTFKRQKSYSCTTAATISVDNLLQPREMTKETHKRINFSQKFFACLFFLPEKCFRTAAVGGSVGVAGNTLCDTCTDTNRHTRRVKIEEVGLSAGEWEREREKKRDICLPYTNTHSLPLTD